jgi:hypothetical protein
VTVSELPAPTECFIGPGSHIHSGLASWDPVSAPFSIVTSRPDLSWSLSKFGMSQASCDLLLRQIPHP